MRRPPFRMMLSAGATAAVAAAFLFWFGSSRAEDGGAAPSPARVDSASPGEARPSPKAMAVPAPKPMPPEFNVLLTRGVFGRPAPVERRKVRGEPSAPEALLVLRGVTVQAARVVALVEDVEAKRVLRVEAGDAVGGGRLTHVALDGVRYVAHGGADREVAIGSNLEGDVVPPPAAVPARAKVKGGDTRDPERKKGQSAAASSN